MKNKKDIPLVILKALESFVNLKGEKFEIVDPQDSLMRIVDKDGKSNFHFYIEKYQKHSPSGTYQFLMSRAPQGQSNNGVYQSWVDISHLQSQFDAWLTLLDEYDKVKTFFDDPILKAFNDEFYAEFEFIDNDSASTPLNTKQILLLDEYLINYQNEIDKYRNDSNSTQITNVISEISVLRENLTTQTKAWVAKKLANVWAKTAKMGTVFIKEMLSESKKAIAKVGVNKAIDFVTEKGPDLLDAAKDIFNN